MGKAEEGEGVKAEDWATVWAKEFLGRHAILWAQCDGPLEDLVLLLRRAKQTGYKQGVWDVASDAGAEVVGEGS